MSDPTYDHIASKLAELAGLPDDIEITFLIEGPEEGIDVPFKRTVSEVRRILQQARDDLAFVDALPYTG